MKISQMLQPVYFFAMMAGNAVAEIWGAAYDPFFLIREGWLVRNEANSLLSCSRAEFKYTRFQHKHEQKPA